MAAGGAGEPTAPRPYRRDYTGGLVLVYLDLGTVRVVLDRAYDVVLGPAALRGGASAARCCCPPTTAPAPRTPAAGRT